MARKINFFAGPSVIPMEVLQTLSEDMIDYKGSGLSLIETSHRSGTYDEVHQSAMKLLKELLQIPDNYKILFLGGGATLQFSMIPLNFLQDNSPCDFTLTGAWAKKAMADAKKMGKVNVIFDGSDDGFMSLPDPNTLEINKDASYVHMTSNETIGGIQWKDFPNTGDVPLICDMSSDILSRPLDIKKFAMIYGGAQKNLAPSGLAMVIIREDLLDRCNENLPAYLDYRTHAKADSLYNTPPVFPIWAMNEVLKRVVSLGGMDYVVEHNRKKADLLYNAIDNMGTFYKSPVAKDVRSDMNVVFNLPTEELEKEFLTGALAKGMLGLKGHRSVGGCRASIYNGMTVEGVEILTQYMTAFFKNHK
ncbi:MAG: 3-phosphoserine/phosphohydroxythreonine transaminase [Spirochaetaceae bacterium]|jgi:phosphoserine aminotransferase|nr:3-phosphoserine/phosphohydroxythreonine transaminase [Spirochaetaceae bacterium]